VTRPISRRYPTLHRLFAGYANQDFDLHGSDPLDSVRAFAREVGEDGRRAALAELERLRVERPTDAALARALDRLRCGVDPAAFGLTYAAFLDRVAEALG
jgi:hypothetical protein